MLLYLLQPTTTSPHHHHHHHRRHAPSPIKTLFLPSMVGVGVGAPPPPPLKTLAQRQPPNHARTGAIASSLLESPVLWAGRLCVYYALIKIGLAGSHSNPFLSSPEIGEGDGGGDLGFSRWIQGLQGRSDDKEASDRRKLVSKWHPTTKGTLKRNYRVPSKAEGRRLLKAIASLLSDDDHFVDATSHK
ncbi:protein prickle isoform X2 [Ananas comosus]|nr:protein prickle isoform X2 [Ananas comosus]